MSEAIEFSFFELTWVDISFFTGISSCVTEFTFSFLIIIYPLSFILISISVFVCSFALTLSFDNITLIKATWWVGKFTFTSHLSVFPFSIIAVIFLLCIRVRSLNLLVFNPFSVEFITVLECKNTIVILLISQQFTYKFKTIIRNVWWSSFKLITIIRAIDVKTLSFSSNSPIIESAIVKNCLEERINLGRNWSVFFPISFYWKSCFIRLSRGCSEGGLDDMKRTLAVLEDVHSDLSNVMRTIMIGDLTEIKVSCLPCSFILDTIITSKLALSIVLVIQEASNILSSIGEC